MLLDSSQSSHIGSNIFKHTVYVGLLLMEALIQMVFCWFLLFVLTTCTTLKYDEIWWNIRKLAEGCRNCITRPPGFCPSPGCLSWFATCIPFPNEQIQWFMLQGFQVGYGGYYTYSISIFIFILHILYISHTHIYTHMFDAEGKKSHVPRFWLRNPGFCIALPGLEGYFYRLVGRWLCI